MPPSDQPEQQHPLYATYRELVDSLLATQQPADGQLVDLGRLLMRYSGFPGALDLQDDLEKTLRLWGLSHTELNQRCRAIWAGGYRPCAEAQEQAVCSGFDTADQDSPLGLFLLHQAHLIPSHGCCFLLARATRAAVAGAVAQRLTGHGPHAGLAG